MTNAPAGMRSDRPAALAPAVNATAFGCRCWEESDGARETIGIPTDAAQVKRRFFAPQLACGGVNADIGMALRFTSTARLRRRPGEILATADRREPGAAESIA